MDTPTDNPILALLDTILDEKRIPYDERLNFILNDIDNLLLISDSIIVYYTIKITVKSTLKSM